MKTQRFLITLTVVNCILLMLSLAQFHQVWASDVARVLRGRMLEIVDDRGRVRASIKVHPADPQVSMPDGTTLPDTTILRLSDPNGRPSVKLSTSERGAGLTLVGDTDATYVILGAKGIKMVKNGGQRLIEP